MTKKTNNNDNPLSSHFFVTIQKDDPEIDNDFDAWVRKYDKNDIVTYAKIAKEEGGDTENIHYHVFFRTSKQQRNSWIFNKLREDNIPFHMDKKVINVKSSIDYAGNPDFTYSNKHPEEAKRGKKKGGKVLYVKEYGDISTVKIPKPGTMGNDLDTRLERIKALIQEGTPLIELYDEDFAVMIKYGHQLKTYLELYYKQDKDVAYIEAIGKKLTEQDKAHRAEIEALEMEFNRQTHLLMSQTL